MRNVICIVPLILFLTAGVLHAQAPKVDAKAEIAASMAAHSAAMDTVAADYDKWLTALQTWYIAGLDKLQGDRAKVGDLDGALAIKAERERIVARTETTQEQIQAMPDLLRKLRVTYEPALKKINDEAARRGEFARRKHLADLEALQKRITMSGDLEQALLVKTAKDQFASDMALNAGAAVLPAGDASASTTPNAPPPPASKEKPFVNALGMKFLPVPITGGPTNGKRVLFSVWDTRVQDYAEYAKAKAITPEKPKFEQGPTEPVVMVSWDDAKAFCEWLTAKDRAAKTIDAQDEYRLPSDHEWSCAVGVGHLENALAFPDTKSGKLAAYPWGTDWPPPKGAGNYSSKLHVDDFEKTSPVGSFAPNIYGLYDMGGNVWQWCEDWAEEKQKGRVLRGGSWTEGDALNLGSTCRSSVHSSGRYDKRGFRCVLATPGS